MNEFLRRLRFLLHRGQFERELDEEIGYHLAMKGSCARLPISNRPGSASTAKTCRCSACRPGMPDTKTLKLFVFMKTCEAVSIRSGRAQRGPLGLRPGVRFDVDRGYRGAGVFRV
jgi:hypothetical protein